MAPSLFLKCRSAPKMQGEGLALHPHTRLGGECAAGGRAATRAGSTSVGAAVGVPGQRGF